METSAGVANTLRSQNPPLKYTIEICRDDYVFSNWPRSAHSTYECGG